MQLHDERSSLQLEEELAAAVAPGGLDRGLALGVQGVVRDTAKHEP